MIFGNFNENPFIVIWEMTRSCALKCVHCRAEAMDCRDPGELDTAQAFDLLRQITRFGNPTTCSQRPHKEFFVKDEPNKWWGKPLVVLTGGDPMRRPDAFEIVECGAKLGLRMAMTPSGTNEMTPGIVQELKSRGLSRLAVSLDGSNAVLHDDFRRVSGSFEWTMNILRWAKEAALSTQINTTVTKRNLGDIDAILELIKPLGISLWSVFFLVPMGRGKAEDGIRGRDYEKVFNRLVHFSDRVNFDIKTTEAPHYRRVVFQKIASEELPDFAAKKLVSGKAVCHEISARAPLGVTPPPACDDRLCDRPMYMGQAGGGVNDGKGFVFISHTGEICPSGFLPLSAGNVKTDPLVEVYRDSELFKTLRDLSKLKGKCGACEYKTVCGGSRARAYAMTGDYMEAEPFCTHIPKGYFASEEEWRYW